VIICLVTDRRRADPVVQARLAIDAGIDLIQIREHDLDGGALSVLVRAVLDVTRGSRTRVVVNERLDVALAAGAAGVHLRGNSISIGDARRLMPRPLLVGRSIHSADEATAAADADYLIAGTVFESVSKPESTSLLGFDGLRAIVRATAVPVLAIGGVTVDRVDQIAASGAAGIAAIGLFASAESLRDRVQTLRSRFDSIKSAT
jgi:thiamine-phosphate pyrophosphorylase